MFIKRILYAVIALVQYIRKNMKEAVFAEKIRQDRKQQTDYKKKQYATEL